MATSVLDLILKQSAKAQEDTAAVADVSKTTFRQQEVLQGQVTDIYSQVATAAGVVARQAQVANIAVQDAKVAAATAAGIGADGKSGRMIDLLAQQRAAGDDVLKTLDEVNRKRNRTIFDIVSDPIGTVKDMLTLEQSETELAGKAQKAKLLTDQIVTTNNSLQETFQTQESLKVVSTAATADAAAQIASAEASILAKRSAMEGLAYNMREVQAVQQASVQTLELMHKSQNAIQAEQTMRNQAAQLAISQRHMALAEEKARWDREAKAQGQEFDKFLADNIATSMKATGMPVPDGIGMRQIVAMAKAGDQSYMFHARNGQRVTATGVSMYGANPAEAVTAIGQYDLNITEQMKPTVDVLKRAMEDPALKMIDRKKEPEKWNKTFNASTQQVIEQEAAQIVPGSGNIFDVGSLTPYLSNPAIATLGITTKLLLPMEQSGASTADARTVLKTAAAAVAKGTITSTEFSQLAVVYQQANLQHQATIGLNRVGIIPPKAGRQYNVPVKTGVFGTTNIDLTDNTAVMRYLATSMAKDYGNPNAQVNAPFKDYIRQSFNPLEPRK